MNEWNRLAAKQTKKKFMCSKGDGHARSIIFLTSFRKDSRNESTLPISN